MMSYMIFIILYEITYDIITDIDEKRNIAEGNITSGAIMSRNRKGKFRSKIWIR